MSDLARQFQDDLDSGYGQTEAHNESRRAPRKASVLGSGIAEANAQPLPQRTDEPRSSIEISQTAKGDVRVSVKAYAAGTSLDDLDAAAAKAADLFDGLRKQYGGAS